MPTATTDELLEAAEKAYAEVEATIGSHLATSADLKAAHPQAAIQRMMRRLDELARGLGLNEATTRRIVEQIAAEMLDRSDEERLDAARQRMIIASAQLKTDQVDPIMEAVAALRAAGVAVTPFGDELECWQIGDLVFSDADLWRLAASRGLVEGGDARQRGAMPKVPSPRGARPRPDTRLRVLAALTSEPATATAIAEGAGIPGRERGMHAARALLRLEADGLAVSEMSRNVPRWRSAAAAPASR